MYPTAALYALLGLITAAAGVALLVYQTAASAQAFRTRRGMLVGGVLLVLVGGLVLVFQIWAIVSNSYGAAG